MAVKEKIVFLKEYCISAIQYSLDIILYNFIGIFYDWTQEKKVIKTCKLNTCTKFLLRIKISRLY